MAPLRSNLGPCKKSDEATVHVFHVYTVKEWGCSQEGRVEPCPLNKAAGKGAMRILSNAVCNLERVLDLSHIFGLRQERY